MCSILLVEDHADTRQAFAGLLRNWGHEVSTSDSSARGLAFLDTNEVDVILSDIGLPDKDGFAFIAQVREKDSKVMAIAMSAYFTAGDQCQCRDAGFDMYYPKPVDLLNLQMVLARMNSRPGRKRKEILAADKRHSSRAA
ncbi:MAG TPA: response regulator [Chthoniobacterales bacterium]|nr:response regulator [Chthoniobacterales bacterium]